MAYEDVACNYASLQDHNQRIIELEKQVKDLIICKDILWNKERGNKKMLKCDNCGRAIQASDHLCVITVKQGEITIHYFCDRICRNTKEHEP